MQLFDLNIKELEKYNPSIFKAKDFNDFWNDRVDEAITQDLNIDIQNIEAPYSGVKVSDIYFDGFRNSRIHGQFIRSNLSEKYSPVVVIFHGYNWNNLQISDALKYVSVGYKVLLLDVRGQDIKTPDHNNYDNGGPAGWMTRGMFNRDNYYYLYVYMDCVRAIEVAKELPGVDPSKIFTDGGSQGGGLSLATAALSNSVTAAIADIPFLCHFTRSIEIGNGTPYDEFSHFSKIFDQQHKREEEIFNVLSYFDNVNLAERIKCPVMITVGLEDTVCPPSTIFAAYNKIKSDKNIFVFPNYGHGGFNEHEVEKIKFIEKD